MTKGRLGGVVLLLACSGFSLMWGITLWRSFPGGEVDFQGVYYGTRCLVEHHDPYAPRELEDFYVELQKASPPKTIDPPFGAMWFIYPPTTCLLVVPFCLLHWKAARMVWLVLLFACYVTAAMLIWKEGKKHADCVSLLLVAWMLGNSEVLLGGANPAGLVASLCVFAVWCFLEERMMLLGVLSLSVSLAFKPHDGGLVWLYFLLVGGMLRRRALQTLGVVVLTGLVALVWMHQAAPHWMHEWHENLTAITSNGHVDDVGALTPEQLGATGPVIDLQSAIAVFWNDARVYNPVTYGICGLMLLVWAWVTVRIRGVRAADWFALAAVVPITMLATYHRPYDAKLLLLSIPACAMLWKHGGKLAWGALAVTAAGLVFTGDLPVSLLMVLDGWLRPATTTLAGRLTILGITRAPSPALLAMAVFYLWVYVKRAGEPGRDTLVAYDAQRKEPEAAL